MNKEWCKHIWWCNSLSTWSGKTIIWRGINVTWIPDNWTCCPICKAKRPTKTAMKEAGIKV